MQNLELDQLSKSISRLFQRIFSDSSGSTDRHESILRSDILTRDELLLQAEDLARQHKQATVNKGSSKIFSRFRENQELVQQAYEFFYEKALTSEKIPPGAEWILDNYYIISEQIREVKHLLPRSYYRSLPKLKTKEWYGLPRAYQLACVYIAHTDSLINDDSLTSFISAYQQITPLTIGELWVLPIMLRLALIENLRRAVQNLWRIQTEQDEVRQIVTDTINDPELSGTNILLKLADKLKQHPRLLKLGAVYLIRELRTRSGHTLLAQQWVEEKLREQKTEPEELEQMEQYLQASTQISISNCITALRNTGAFDWTLWFEKVCLIEERLNQDPDGLYPKSDFNTRNDCRSQIEYLARRSKRSEQEICEKLFEFNKIKSSAPLLHWLLQEDGRRAFIKYLGLRPKLHEISKRITNANALKFYLALVLIITTTILMIVNKFTADLPLWLNIPVLLLSLLSASEIAIQINQWLFTLFSHPTRLPKLNHEVPLSTEHKTLIVVNNVLKSKPGIEQAVNDLEVKFLANDDAQFKFAVLADLCDADKEVLPTDAALFSQAAEAIQRLNSKYGFEDPRFYIIFRKRTYSQTENSYFGLERKRGKLSELNNLLLHGQPGTFIINESTINSLQGFNYVLTLDADSQLPLNSAKKLVCTIAHPLNYPEIDPLSNTVRKGYALLQPLMSNSINSANLSRFAQLIASDSGIDPYSSLTSEVYQDFFGEGTYIGKGIYDIKVFETVLGNKAPPESLLSHDLFEGNLVRCALVSDIVLIDSVPSKLSAEFNRQHRWARGDWQLLPWLRRKVRNDKNQLYPNPVSMLGQWKIFDNLRRSLLAPVNLVLILLAAIIPNQKQALLLLPITSLTLPLIFSSINFMCFTPVDKNLLARGQNFSMHFFKTVSRIMLNLAILPKVAVSMLDAACLTIIRVYFTRKHLLEWVTADIAEQSVSNDLGSYIKNLLAGIMLGVLGLTLLIFNFNPWSFGFFAVIFALWIIAPYTGWRISQPLWGTQYQPKRKEAKYLLQVGKKTWNYFDRFLTPEYNFLIPDNLQMEPTQKVALRSSPTNIGLSLLTVISAVDLGYITLPYGINKIKNILDSIHGLEKFSGHLLNWYDIKSRAALSPRYISFVDSTNFIAYCLTAKQTLKEYFHAPLIKVIEPATYIPREANTDECFSKHNDETAGIQELHEILCWYPLLARLEKLIPATHTILNDDLEGLRKIVSARGISLTLTAKINQRLNEISEKITQSDLNSETKLLAVELAEAAKRSEVLVQTYANAIRFAIEELKVYVNNADLSFLYNNSKHLFAIGYNLDNASVDNSFYDLLCSEARLGSLLAIALDQAPAKHWFRLGRSISKAPGGKSLYSWTGTMFEYLLPNLLTKDYPGTLLTESNKAAIRTQIWFGKNNNIPWGVSESAHSGVDFEHTFQYRAFGIPELGLKRGLAEDLVIAPYSTFLALPYTPRRALFNLRHLEATGALGEYGFYESIDYSSKRLSSDEKFYIVKTFFAHHQGMSLCAINNFINNLIFQERFHSEPRIQASELLLQEKFPVGGVKVLTSAESSAGFYKTDDSESASLQKITFSPHTALPECNLLSNGTYSVLLTNNGSGKSFIAPDLLLNTWQESLIRNDYGQFVYIKDLASGYSWSNTFQPLLTEPDHYEFIAGFDKTEFKRIDRQISTHTEVTVSPEFNAEIRRLTLTNLSGRKRRLQLTSFFEVALARAAAFYSHPAFSRAFVQSEYLPEYEALLFQRRPRNPREKTVCCFMQLNMPVCWDQTYYETSRKNFIGRGRTLHNPQALQARNLSNTVGSVLDCCAALQTVMEIAPGFSANLSFVSGIAGSREEALNCIKIFHEQNSINRTFDLAWSKSNIEIRNEQSSIAEMHRYQRLAGSIFFNNPLLSATRDIISKNHLSQQGLWRLGISGDQPIVLLRISDPEHLPVVKEMILAHEFLRRRGLIYDLLIINSYFSGYMQDFSQKLEETILGSPAGHLFDKNGGVFLRNAQQISAEEDLLLNSVARVSLNAADDGIKDKLDSEVTIVPNIKSDYSTRTEQSKNILQLSADFLPAQNEFEIILPAGASTPKPWVNVIGTKNFGTLISETGGGWTWSENSRENRLTVWENDPVCDRPQEIIYLVNHREESYWSSTPQPSPGKAPYRVRHGFGYSTFETSNHNTESHQTVYVSANQKVKWSKLKLTNKSNSRQNLSVFWYANLSIGNSKVQDGKFINGGYSSAPEFLYAQNFYNNEFSGRVVFAGSDHELTAHSTNAAEVIGRNGSEATPLVIRRLSDGILSSLTASNTNNSHDPQHDFNSQCFMLRVDLQLDAGDSETVHFYIAEEKDLESARNAARLYRFSRTPKKEAEEAKEYWKNLTGKISIETPVASFNNILSWLPYQNISCRINARSSLYQSGGAIGFRDQLQDVLALLYISPEITRQQILMHAARQFVEGDVQHWWHPPTGRGTRTKISDDLHFLPYATARYIEVTGDLGILDENIPFLFAPQIKADQHDLYCTPEVSQESAPLWNHCLRAIKHARFSERGLALMGSGDWNDGMDEVGYKGQGESVWLSFFLTDVIAKFLPYLKKYDPQSSEELNTLRSKLISSIDEHCWDGEWYLRAFYDDGTALGTNRDIECKIDSLPQSWSVISGAGNQERAQQALQNAYDKLVDKNNRVIKLFTEPFDKTPNNPGYIKGYLPGIRENGAQYTHAACWLIMAHAQLKEHEKAFELFQLINPADICTTSAGLNRYQGEPYVISADVYSKDSLAGQAGWTWYTGSSGWYFRVAVEYILGLKLFHDRIVIDPCIPKSWPGFKITFEYKGKRIHLEVKNPTFAGSAVKHVILNGQKIEGNTVLAEKIILNDLDTHQIIAEI